MTHCVYIEVHDPGVCVCEHSQEPIINMLRVHAELDHEAEQEQSVNMVRILIDPHLLKNVLNNRMSTELTIN